ncbi:VOC family protein [Vibrio stylophorae]|nr:VOC family protein [Vibrio stylophorae]
MQLLGLDHIVLRTAQLETLQRFYLDLGCELERQVPEFGLVQLRAGSALLDLVDCDGPLGQEGGPPPNGKGHNMAHFCLQLAPIEPQALHQKLAERNLTHQPFIQRYGATGFGDSVYIFDPDGNCIELKPLCWLPESQRKD